jgi:hypothetical protein
MSTSAQNSLKRTRVLYDINPQAAFLPSVDPTIAQLAFQRRKRRPQSIVNNNVQQTGNSMALSLQVAPSDAPAATMEPISKHPQQTNNNNNSSLVALGGQDPNAQANNQDQNKGILTLVRLLAVACTCV